MTLLEAVTQEPLEVRVPIEGKEPRRPRLRHVGVQPTTSLPIPLHRDAANDQDLWTVVPGRMGQRARGDTLGPRGAGRRVAASAELWRGDDSQPRYLSL